jgi:hypothetical protein
MSGIVLPRGEKMSKNPITGDEIKSKINTPEFETNFDRIFRNKSEANKPTKPCPNANSTTGCYCTGACRVEEVYKNLENDKCSVAGSNEQDHKPSNCILSKTDAGCLCSSWNEKRMDIIGQNGNVGYSVDDIYQQVEKDYREK